jgi:hypothetical protein
LGDVVFEALRCEAAKNCKNRDDSFGYRHFERQQNCSIPRAVVHYTLRLFAPSPGAERSCVVISTGSGTTIYPNLSKPIF